MMMQVRIFGLLFVFLVLIPEKANATSSIVISDLSQITNLAGTYAFGGDINGASHNTLGDFSGQLDGQGYKLINLTSPVFNELLTGSVIRNLSLEDVRVTGSFMGDVGALANRATGVINLDNIEISGDVTGTGITGGLVGAYRYSSTTGISGDTTFISLNRINLVDLEVSGSNSSGGLFGIVDISVNKQVGNTCSNACGQINNTDSINDSNITGILITDSEFRNLSVNVASRGSSGGLVGDFAVRNNTETLVQSNFSYLGGDIQTSASVTNNGKSVNNGSTIGLDLSDSIFENILIRNVGTNPESKHSGGLIGNLLVSSSAKSNSKVFAFTGLGEASYVGTGQVINSALAYAMNTGDISAINLSDVNLNNFTVTSSSAFAGLVVGDLNVEKTVEAEALILLNGSTANSSGTVINQASSTNTGNLRAISSMNLNSNAPMSQNIGNISVNQDTSTRATTDIYRSTVFTSTPGSNSGISSNQSTYQGSSYLSRSTNANNINNSNIVFPRLTKYFNFDSLPFRLTNLIDILVINLPSNSFLFEPNGYGPKIINAVQKPVSLDFNLPTTDPREVWIQINDEWLKLGYANKVNGVYKIPNIVFKKSGVYKIGFLNPDIPIDRNSYPNTKDLEIFEFLVLDLG
jgi:hypothetical protein